MSDVKVQWSHRDHRATQEVQLKATDPSSLRISGLYYAVKILSPDGVTVLESADHIVEPSYTISWSTYSFDYVYFLVSAVLEGKRSVPHFMPIKFRPSTPVDMRFLSFGSDEVIAPVLADRVKILNIRFSEGSSGLGSSEDVLEYVGKDAVTLLWDDDSNISLDPSNLFTAEEKVGWFKEYQIAILDPYTLDELATFKSSINSAVISFTQRKNVISIKVVDKTGEAGQATLVVVDNPAPFVSSVRKVVSSADAIPGIDTSVGTMNLLFTVGNAPASKIKVYTRTDTKPYDLTKEPLSVSPSNTLAMPVNKSQTVYFKAQAFDDFGEGLLFDEVKEVAINVTAYSADWEWSILNRPADSQIKSGSIIEDFNDTVLNWTSPEENLNFNLEHSDDLAVSGNNILHVCSAQTRVSTFTVAHSSGTAVSVFTAVKRFDTPNSILPADRYAIVPSVDWVTSNTTSVTVTAYRGLANSFEASKAVTKVYWDIVDSNGSPLSTDNSQSSAKTIRIVNTKNNITIKAYLDVDKTVLIASKTLFAVYATRPDLVVIPSREFESISCGYDGLIKAGAITGLAVSFRVFKGTNEVTSACTFTVVSPYIGFSGYTLGSVNAIVAFANNTITAIPDVPVTGYIVQKGSVALDPSATYKLIVKYRAIIAANTSISFGIANTKIAAPFARRILISLTAQNTSTLWSTETRYFNDGGTGTGNTVDSPAGIDVANLKQFSLYMGLTQFSGNIEIDSITVQSLTANYGEIDWTDLANIPTDLAYANNDSFQLGFNPSLKAIKSATTLLGWTENSGKYTLIDSKDPVLGWKYDNSLPDIVDSYLTGKSLFTIKGTADGIHREVFFKVYLVPGTFFFGYLDFADPTIKTVGIVPSFYVDIAHTKDSWVGATRVTVPIVTPFGKIPFFAQASGSKVVWGIRVTISRGVTAPTANHDHLNLRGLAFAIADPTLDNKTISLLPSTSDYSGKVTISGVGTITSSNQAPIYSTSEPSVSGQPDGRIWVDTDSKPYQIYTLTTFTPLDAGYIESMPRRWVSQQDILPKNKLTGFIGYTQTPTVKTLTAADLSAITTSISLLFKPSISAGGSSGIGTGSGVNYLDHIVWLGKSADYPSTWIISKAKTVGGVTSIVPVDTISSALLAKQYLVSLATFSGTNWVYQLDASINSFARTAISLSTLQDGATLSCMLTYSQYTWQNKLWSITGQLGGLPPGAMIGNSSLSDLGSVYLDFNKQNNRIGTAIVGDITNFSYVTQHDLFGNGTSNITLSWLFPTESEAAIDGFVIRHVAYDVSTTPVFTLATKDLVRTTAPDRSVNFVLLSNKFHSFQITAYRFVDADINVTRVIESAVARTIENVQPLSSLTFNGVDVKSLQMYFDQISDDSVITPSEKFSTGGLKDKLNEIKNSYNSVSNKVNSLNSEYSNIGLTVLTTRKEAIIKALTQTFYDIIDVNIPVSEYQSVLLEGTAKILKTGITATLQKPATVPAVSEQLSNKLPDKVAFKALFSDFSTELLSVQDQIAVKDRLGAYTAIDSVIANAVADGTITSAERTVFQTRLADIKDEYDRIIDVAKHLEITI
jgi:hypothetical protein